jgi:hypothetical protein
MARGWESKSIESQQDDASRSTVTVPAAAPSTDQLARAEQRRSLELQRKRVADDLTRAAAPAHRKMLQEAMSALDAQIAALGG